MCTLKVSDFSRYPGGRVKSQGPNSGEEYRLSCFEPAVSAGEPVTVDLRGLEILLPSFIDEAFGPYCQRVGEAEFKKKVSFIFPYPDSEAEFFVNQMISRRTKSKSK